MGFIAGYPMADLIDGLVTQGYRFDFFAAVAALESRLRGGKEGDPLEDGRVRFLSNTAHVFPASDIKSVTQTEADFRFLLSFMGLCGVSSPLPFYFTEYVDNQPDDSAAMREFLDMFSHRMYVLFFRAWKKYRFETHLAHAPGISFEQIARALAGCTHANNSLAPLVATGSLAMRCRSAGGLKALIEAAFEGCAVNVVEWVARWITVDNPQPLGRARLGSESLLGTRCRQRGSSVRIVMGPLTCEQYTGLLPGTEGFARLCGLVRGFCTDMTPFDVELQIPRQQLTAVVLGHSTATLGTTSRLGACSDPSLLETIIIEPSPANTGSGKAHNHDFARHSSSA